MPGSGSDDNRKAVHGLIEIQLFVKKIQTVEFLSTCGFPIIRDELLHNIPGVRFFISTITARRRILRDICDDSAFLKLYFEEFIKKSSSFIVNFSKNKSFKTPTVSALSDHRQSKEFL